MFEKKAVFWHCIIGSQFSLGTPPFILELSTEKQMTELLEQSKVAIPVITKTVKAVEDERTSLKQIMARAQKERENSAKVPQLPVKEVKKKDDSGDLVVEEKISECSYLLYCTG